MYSLNRCCLSMPLLPSSYQCRLPNNRMFTSVALRRRFAKHFFWRSFTFRSSLHWHCFILSPQLQVATWKSWVDFFCLAWYVSGIGKFPLFVTRYSRWRWAPFKLVCEPLINTMKRTNGKNKHGILYSCRQWRQTAAHSLDDRAKHVSTATAVFVGLFFSSAQLERKTRWL